MVDEVDSRNDRPSRGPFQFTIRTLLLLTFVVALFCSAAITFEGISQTLAIIVLAWATVGLVHLRRRIDVLALIAHGTGPIISTLLWIPVLWGEDAIHGHFWHENLDLLMKFLVIGFFVSTVVSPVVAAKNWLNQ